MKKASWQKRIKKACEDAGTYEPFFNDVIAQLAEIMELKDNAMKQYEATGGHPVVAYTNKGGQTNLKKNPALVVIMECNAQALAYWRDLGLTVKAYKSLGESSKKESEDNFSKLLGSIMD